MKKPKPKKIEDFTAARLKHVKFLEFLAEIKYKEIYDLQQIGEYFNIAQITVRRWKDYHEALKYRCYIKYGTTKSTILVHPKYKAELIKSGLATERY